MLRMLYSLPKQRNYYVSSLFRLFLSCVAYLKHSGHLTSLTKGNCSILTFRRFSSRLSVPVSARPSTDRTKTRCPYLSGGKDMDIVKYVTNIGKLGEKCFDCIIDMLPSGCFDIFVKSIPWLFFIYFLIFYNKYCRGFRPKALHCNPIENHGIFKTLYLHNH